MKKKILLSLLTLLTGITSLFAQSKMRMALDTLQKFYPQEKIYILYNKAQYTAGETMWFSAFVFAGYEPSLVSSNLFIELYDNEKHLLDRKQLPLLHGQAAGQLTISQKLSENVYFIRAYTQWMLNFPENYQYIHPIEIYNPKSPKKLRAQYLPWKAEAFPEGGNLVDGIPARVAVRLFSPSPLPPTWFAYLVEPGHTEKIAEANSLDPNVAILQFIPAAAHQYQVVVEDGKGQRQVINLPAAISTGLHLEIHNLNDSIQYTIRFKGLPGLGKGYKLIGSMNNEILYEAFIRKSDSILTRFISTAEFNNGILRLSLFDPDDNVVAERLCFVKPTAPSVKTPDFTEQGLNSSARSLNSLQFRSDTIENPFSILVMDPVAKDPSEEENFLTALWLNEDLSKPIQKPAQYFEHPGPTSAEALDALLISETWQRFNWNDILHGKYPETKFFPDNYISYKGTAYRNKKPVANEAINLIFYFADSSTQFVQVKTDSMASFVLHNLFFFDSVRVYYQANSKKSFAKDIHIQFETLNRASPYQSSFPVTAYTLVTRDPGDQQPEMVTRTLNTLNNQQFADDRYKTLEEVRVRTKQKTAKEKLEEELSSPSFTGFNETVFDFVNEDQHADSYSNILEWLQGRVAGLQINFSNGDLIPVIRGTAVEIFVDEMRMDPSFINGFPVNDIAMVKVIKGYFVGGWGGGGEGAIAIYTKKGNMRSYRSQPLLSNNKLKGYDKIENFPSPDYSENIYKQVKLDTRDVLFWNPFAVSENDQLKIPIRFYNNDVAKEFRVIIVGFTIDGQPIYYNRILR